METGKESRIKPCVILFAEITQIDTWLSEIETEEYAELLGSIFEKLDNAVNLYEGHIDKHEGRVLMATFGVPIAHEEDSERAVKAGLLMLNQIMKLNQELKKSVGLRIGINLGRVYASHVGSKIKTEFTVMGDAVNFAARIMEHARDFELLVSDEIYQIVKPLFEFSEPVKFLPQGAKQEITVYNVLRQRTGFVKRRGIEGLSSPLVGRKLELDLLLQFMEELFSGKGNVVIILGEAGVGKSRLLEELFTRSLSIGLERVRNINWCISRCSPYKETGYYAFLEIIKQICNIQITDSEMLVMSKLLATIEKLARESAEEIFPYIANLFDIKLVARYEEKIKYLKPEEIKLQTQSAIKTLMQVYSENEPTVFCVDDLYLADDITLQTLKFLLESNGLSKSLVILISRPEKDKPFWQMKEKLKNAMLIKEIMLKPLSEDETKELSKNLLKIPKLPAEIINKIVQDSGGNPFFLEELIKLLISKGFLFRRGNEWLASDRELEFSIPYTIEGIIQASFDALDENLRGLLSEISVLGRTFNKKMLQAFTKYWENLDGFLIKLSELGYLYSSNDQDYAFSHALVREAIYKSIPEKQLRKLHLAIAQAIESLFPERLSEYYDILFEHYNLANEKDKAVFYALKAGEKCIKQYANTEAIGYYLYVLKELSADYPDKNQVEFETLKKLGGIYQTIGKSDDAFEIYNKALQLTQSKKEKAIILNLIADTYQRISEYEESLNWYNKSLNLLIDFSEKDKVDTYLGIAWIHYIRGDLNIARELLENVSNSIKDLPGIELREKMARLYNQLGAIYSHSGEYEKSFDVYNKALKLYEMLEDIPGQAVIFNNIHGHYTRLGDYYRALEYLNKSLEIDLKTGNILARAIATYNIGHTYLQLGDLERAEEKFNEYLEINARINNQLGNGYGNMGLGIIYLERGDLTKSETFFNKAYEIFDKLQSLVMKRTVSMYLAELELEKSNFDASFSMYEELKKEFEEIFDPDDILDCIMGQANVRIKQGIYEKRLAIAHFNAAYELLKQAEEYINKTMVNIETKFIIYFYLTEVNYYLTKTGEAIEYFNRAENLVQVMISKIPEGEPRQKFLNKRVFREYIEFKDRVKFR